MAALKYISLEEYNVESPDPLPGYIMETTYVLQDPEILVRRIMGNISVENIDKELYTETIYKLQSEKYTLSSRIVCGMYSFPDPGEFDEGNFSIKHIREMYKLPLHIQALFEYYFLDSKFMLSDLYVDTFRIQVHDMDVTEECVKWILLRAEKEKFHRVKLSVSYPCLILYSSTGDKLNNIGYSFYPVIGHDVRDKPLFLHSILSSWINFLE